MNQSELTQINTVQFKSTLVLEQFEAYLNGLIESHTACC